MGKAQKYEVKWLVVPGRRAKAPAIFARYPTCRTLRLSTRYVAASPIRFPKPTAERHRLEIPVPAPYFGGINFRGAAFAVAEIIPLEPDSG